MTESKQLLSEFEQINRVKETLKLKKVNWSKYYNTSTKQNFHHVCLLQQQQEQKKKTTD